MRHSPLTAHILMLQSLPVERKPRPGIIARARTQSECPTYVCSQVAPFQRLIVLSAEAVSMRPSSRQSTAHTACSWPVMTVTHWRVDRSHTRAVLSQDTDTKCPDGVTVIPHTVSVCPSRVATSEPASQMLMTGLTIV